jgi:hypothetical protein
MKYELYPHQQQGVEYLESRLANNLGGALFMEMRTGKTLTFLRFYKANKHLFPNGVIISAPASVGATWFNSIVEDSDEYGHLPLEKALLLPRQELIDTLGVCPLFKGTKPQKVKALTRAKQLEHKIFIVTHASLRLIDWGFDPSALVIDESVILANPKNGYTKHAIAMNVLYKYVLCGNPQPEGPHQLFMQMKAVQGAFCGFQFYYSFVSSCFNEFGYKLKVRKQWEGRIISQAATDGFVRTRKEIGLGNTKQHRIEEVPMSEEQLNLYEDMIVNWEAEGMVADYVMTQQLYLQRISGGYILHEDNKYEFISNTKVDRIVELMKEELKGEPVIIWCKFISEIEHIYSTLTKEGFKGYKGWGGTKSDDDDLARRNFNAGKLDFMVLQLKKFNAGINLAGGSTMIYYSNEWSCNIRSQSEDRCTAMGKDTPTLIIDLCCENSIDHMIVSALKNKEIDYRKLMSEARFLYLENKNAKRSK